MELLAPAGLAALALIPPLVLLYFLKLKRTPVVISSSLLWAKALVDSRANAPFQRLRRNLLLLLQILVLVLVALALSRPAMTVKGRSAAATVIVIDASASMAAGDVRPSRFAHAKDEAARIVGDLGQGDEAMVVWAGPRPRVAASFGRDRNVLRRAIDALEPADAAGDLRGALTLALSASAGRGSREVVVLTDGAFDAISDLSLGDVPVRYLKIGEEGDNAAIVAIDVRRRAGNTRQGFATVANFGTQEVALDLEVRLRPEEGGASQLLELKPMLVPPGGERSDVFMVPEAGGLLEVSISDGGALGADDRVFVALPSPGKVPVAVTGSDTVLVRRALEADPRIRLLTGVSAAEAASTEVSVWVNARPPSFANGRFLVIEPADGGGLFAVSGPVENPGRVHWEPRHPLLRWTGLGDVHVGEAIATTPPPGAEVVAEAGAVPLVWAYERPRLKLVVASFDPFASDLPLRPGWPIFLANSVDWLLAGRGSDPRVVAAGEIATGEAPEGVEEVTVTDPRGVAHRIGVREGEWIFDGTTRTGVYEVRAGKQQQRFAVNLLSRAESDVRPRAALDLGASKVRAEAPEKVRRRMELWPWLVLAALGLIGGEWLLFHKRGG